MTQAYSAGALLSTVDDLWIWIKGLNEGKVVSLKSYKLMTTPTKYTGSKTKNYGYGFWLNPLFGEKTISHNGGIFGFLTYVIYLPERNIFVAVLTNALVVVDAPFMGQWTAALLSGKDVKRKEAITLGTQILDNLTGIYEISKGVDLNITKEGTKLYSQKTGGRKLEVFASSETEFFYEDSFTSFTVVKDKSGKVTKLVMKNQGTEKEAIKTDRKLKERRIIELDTKIFEEYVGQYTSEEGIEITIAEKDGKFYAQLKGQPQFEIFPETETKFFFKVAEAQLEFKRDESGKVAGLTIYQGGKSLKMRRKLVELKK
jgi:hypothetical protein